MVKFHVPTWSIFTGPVTNLTSTSMYKTNQKVKYYQFVKIKIVSLVDGCKWTVDVGKGADVLNGC